MPNFGGIALYNLYKRIEELCKLQNITITDMCRKSGVPRSTLSDYKSGRIKSIAIDKLNKIAIFFDVSVDYLLGNTNIKKEPPTQPVGQLVTIKVIASVRAGYDGSAIEDCEDKVEVIPKHLLKGYNADDCRVFIAKGNSMYPIILDGDRLIVHVQPTVDNGEVAVVIYNGDEGTVKKVRRGKNYFDMIPINPEYQTRHIEGPDLEQCHIFGKVISLWRDF